jgi:hypothetical protein
MVTIVVHIGLTEEYNNHNSHQDENQLTTSIPAVLITTFLILNLIIATLILIELIKTL